jgi:hypothetical protein
MTPPFGMAAAFVGAIVVVAFGFTWAIADARSSGRFALVAVLGVAIAVLAIAGVRLALRKGMRGAPEEVER